MTSMHACPDRMSPHAARRSGSFRSKTPFATMTAAVALLLTQAPVQAKFQRYIEGGRSVQEIADYLVTNGLRFAPATINDEAAYRAIHTALASYDVAMNSQNGIDNKD